MIKHESKYGRLTILKDLGTVKRICPSSQTSDRRVLTQCDCGTIKEISLNEIKKGSTQSCGCLAREKTSKRVKTHGLSKTKEYKRLNNKKHREKEGFKQRKNQLERERRLRDGDRLRLSMREKYRTNLQHKLSLRLRGRLNEALRKNTRNGSAVRDLGCSLDELKSYLENRFQEGMSWDNWTKNGWHIDHIIPISKFDLSIPEEVKKACHYTNLQPMWADENIRKGNRI